MSCSSQLSYSSYSSPLHSKDAALFAYAAWGTRDGQAVLDCDQTRQAAYLAITIRLRSRFCHVMSVGGTASQIHLIARFPASLPISDIIRMGQAAAEEAIVRVQETFEDRPLRTRTLWETQYTTHTLGVTDARDAHSYLRRQIMETDSDR